MDQIFEWSSVKKHVEIQQPIENIPATSMKGFHLDLWKLSFYENAKYGETGRFPATHSLKAHFGSFLENGFESHRECLEVKFRLSKEETEQSIYKVNDFSVGYVDGQNKAIIMLSIMALLIDLDPWNTISMRTIINMKTMINIIKPWFWTKFLVNLLSLLCNVLCQSRGSKKMRWWRMKLCQKLLPLSGMWSATMADMKRLKGFSMRHLARALALHIITSRSNRLLYQYVSITDPCWFFPPASCSPRPCKPHCWEDQAISLGYAAGVQGVDSDQTVQHSYKEGGPPRTLFASVADYYKTVNNHRAPCLTLFSLVSILKWYIYGIFHGPKSKAQSKAWRVGDSTRKLIYNLLRSPKGLLDALKACYNESKPEHAGWVFFSNI